MDDDSKGSVMRSGTLNWSKVHLVYFALAAFDLLAIALGLWLSNHTGNKFEKSIASVEGVQFIKERASNLMLLSTDLSRPVNDIFTTSSPGPAMADLKKAYETFQEFASEENFNKAIGELTGQDMEAMGSLGGDAQKRIAAALHVSDEVIEAYEENEDSLRDQAEEIFNTSTLAIKAHESGNVAEATVNKKRSDEASRAMVGLINKLAIAADQNLHRVLEDSKNSFSFASMMQYLIGAAIFLMVSMVLIYGHFVGKLLRQKFSDLADAKLQSEGFNLQLQSMNDDISKLNVDLNDKVQSLKQVQDELVKKGRMEQLGQLTATVAHEIRNPLGAVRTSAFLLERKLKNKGLGVESALDRINAGIVRCDNIITQLLDFSRTRQLSCQPGDLDKWLSGVIEEEAQNLPNSVNVELSLGLSDQAVPFDQARLQRAVINMVNNAVEAMFPLGIMPNEVISEPKLAISTFIEDEHVGLRVKDNGPGISAEVLARIREPLFTTKGFGTGLGVPAVEQIAAQHGGRLDIESVVGSGSTFTVWLPMRQTLVGETEKAA